MGVGASEQAGWAGDGDRSLFLRVHQPDDGQVVGGVLICPPLGHEHHFAYPTLRALAKALVAQGMVVVHLDYLGTGDSAGGAGSAEVEDWLESVRRGLQVLRTSGAPRLGVVGMRIGALLAHTALAADPPDVLVLWDPVLRGKSFLREQQLLMRTNTAGTAAPDEDGAVHGHSLVYRPEVAAALRRLSIDALPPARDLLVVQRAGQATEGWSARATTVTQLETTEQEAMLEAFPMTTAHTTVTEVAHHLAARLTGPAVPVRAVPLAERVEVKDRLGRTVRESLWSGAGMVGILSQPLVEPDTTRPPVLLLPSGLFHRVGPGRIWVEVARECAASGLTVLRVDVTGLGDSPPRPGREPLQTHTQDAVDDVTAAAVALRPDGPVRLVGHCASAWSVLKAAPEVRPASVHLLNMLPYSSSEAWRQIDSRQEGPRPLKVRLLSLGNDPRLQSRRHHLPWWFWSLLDRTRILPSPMRELSNLVAQGSRVHILNDHVDGTFFRIEARRQLARMRPDQLEVEVLEVSDHGLISVDARRAMARSLVDHLLERPGHPDGSAAPAVSEHPVGSGHASGPPEGGPARRS